MIFRFPTHLIKSFIIPIFFVCIVSVFAECEMTDDLGYTEYSRGKFSYECNVQNRCLGQGYGGDYWNFDTSKQLVIEHDKQKYGDLSSGATSSLNEVRKIYLDTQNQIMNCAVTKSKYAVHKALLAQYTFSPRIRASLEAINMSLEQQLEEYACTPPKKDDVVSNYKNMLDSLSYEQCVYGMYLWYIDASCQHNASSCLLGTKPETYREMAHVTMNVKTHIDDEIQITRDSMSTALGLYSYFEENYPAHIMLSLIAIELTTSKVYVDVMWEALKQWLSVVENAQKSAKDGKTS